MVEDSTHEDELLEKYNISQYRGRFGISYSSKSSKILSPSKFSDIVSSKKIVSKLKLKLQKETSIRNNISLEVEEKPNLHSNILNEIKEIELERIYSNFHERDEDILPIANFKKVNKCSIIKYGIKKSTEEIEYSYCKTCDHNLVRPICLSCINKCHFGHSIYYIFSRGRIKCSCGEKNHVTVNINNNYYRLGGIKCLCNEWNAIAKLGFYYINKKNKPICILCHNYCEKNDKKDKIIKIEENKEIPECSCKNETIHNSHRAICEKIIDLIKEYNEFHILLHPIQFVNMLFKSKNNFKLIFEDFEIFVNNLNNPDKLKNIGYFSKFHSIDITNTNVYKTLLIFEKMVQKKARNNYIYYYNKEVINYFSFNVIKNLFWALEQFPDDEKSYRILINKYLYLFHKFYIDFLTQSLVKYKLKDLKNLSFLQRIIIFNKNQDIEKESEEIISFLLRYFNHIIYNGQSSFDSIECIKEILGIFRKFTCYNLINNEQITKISINILKCFDYIRIIRNNYLNNNSNKNTDIKSSKDLSLLNKLSMKMYYIIMKIILNSIYNYNDNILKKIIFDKEKYPDINNISFDNVCFIYKRNELGRFIFEITISILTYIQKYFYDYENKKIILTQRIGMEILQYSLNNDDDYILNIIDSLNQTKFYFSKSQKILNITNNQYYKELSRQCNLLSNCFYQYFNFEKSIEDIIELVNDSLNFVLGEESEKIISLDGDHIHHGFNHNQKTAILSTNYFNLVSRVIGIINHYQNRNNVFNDKKKDNNIKLNFFIHSLPINVEDEIIKKILYFYSCFVYNSSDNSILILSYSIFTELTKLPTKFCQSAFKLFYICIKNIMDLDNENSNIFILDQRHIIKRLYNYLEKLLEDKNIKPNTLLTCVYYFLKSIEITVFNSYSSFFNNYIYKIQYILVQIDKKYNIINKFFDMKDSEFISNKKNKQNKSDKNIRTYKDIPSKASKSIFIKKDSSEKLIPFGFEFYRRSFLQKSFIIFIKLINDCFDFSLETDRKKVQEMINIEKVIFSLQFYKLNLDLRTEFLRLLRKILLDIKYSNKDNFLYTKIFINNKDSLGDLKNNPLMNNMEYPTKLLSFLKNFYNLTAKCVLKEKIIKKHKIIENKLKDLKLYNSPSHLSVDKNKNEYNNRKELANQMKISINNKAVNGKVNNIKIEKPINNKILKLENINNNSREEEEKTMSTKKYIDEHEFKEFEIDIEKEKSFMDSNRSSPKVISSKHNFFVNGVIVEEKEKENVIKEGGEIDSGIFISKVSTMKNIDVKNKNKSKKSLLHVRDKNFMKINTRTNVRRSKKSYFFGTVINKDLLAESKKSLKISIPPNQVKEIVLNEDSDVSSEELENLMKVINEKDNEKFYSECKKNEILEDAFNETFYEIINYELDNVKKNIENIKLNNPEKIEYVRNYIENGILIPLIFYFKKIFTLVHLFSGEEMKNLFVLMKKAIKFKMFISEFEINFWKNTILNKNKTLEENPDIFHGKNEILNSQHYFYTKYRNASIIDGDNLKDIKTIELTYETLNYINSNKISIYDYSTLYQIIEKELFSLIKDRKVLNIKDNFSEKKNKLLNKKIMENDEKLLLYEKDKNNMSDFQKRLFKALIIYKYCKLTCFNETNSSFFSILTEITLGYETNYRTLLITLLIKYGKDLNIKNEFSDISYLLLFKLLSFQTLEIQNDIMNLLGGKDIDDEPGFLKDFSNMLFCRIILLFIDYLNPPDKLHQSNYFVSCNLIYIFKNLCEQHNNYFQRHLVKSLSYFYIQNNPSFFQFNGNEDIDYSKSFNDDFSIHSSGNSSIKDSEKESKYKCNIPFYDFFLYLLIKIILISNWENNNKKNYQYQNPYLYDLFTSILELLTGVIQGSEHELLSTLCINIEEGVEIIGENVNFEKHKKVDSFEFFIKNIKNILFQEKYNLELINKLRINIIHYITALLEEKYCNEIMKKYIKKYININDIYKIICIIMKSYYLNKERPNKFKRIKRPIVGLFSSSRLSEFKPKKVTLQRKHSNVSPILRPRMKKINNKFQKKPKYSLDGSTSSNIKLLNNSTYNNMSFDKKLSILNLEKNKFDLFKRILVKDEMKVNRDSKILIKKNKTEINENKDKDTMLELKISNFIFGKKLYLYFKKQFYETIEFTETWQFKLSNSFYRYIKILKPQKNISKEILNIEQIKKIVDIEGDIFLDNLNDKKASEEKKTIIKDNLIYEKDLLEKYYIEKFFEDITEMIEIRTNEGNNKFILYTKLPCMKFLSKETQKDFNKTVNRDNETSKKNDLMRYIEYFFKEIKHYKKYRNKWSFFCLKIDFHYMIILSYLYALIYNLLLLFTVKGDIQISEPNILKERFQNELKIQNFIDNSINKWKSTYITLGYIYLILNLSLIIIWILYKLPLYYKIDQIKYKEMNNINRNKKLFFINKLYVLFRMSIIDRNYISMLIYEFVIGIICISSRRSEIIYAFLLLPILIINKTLKNIMISIKLNYRQFSLTLCLAFIIMYIFSNVYFFFLNSDFYTELNYYSDNYCKTLIFSFLNAIDNGLRARGGIGDTAKRISFLKNKKHYIIRLILDDLFFLLIVIIMIDMVFGIIINSFDELRHRNQKYHKDKKNICYICHSNRDSLEKVRINFKEHVKKTHCLWNYVEYMISLKMKDIHDLNDANQLIREKIDKKDITWLPTYKDIIKSDNINNNNDVEESNLAVFTENLGNYKIKTSSTVVP